jgi:hypothetical protein
VVVAAGEGQRVAAVEAAALSCSRPTSSLPRS